MKLVRFFYKNERYIGKLDNNKLYPLKDTIGFGDDSLELIKTLGDLGNLAFRNDPIDLTQAQLLCPISRTENDLLCIGLNYRSHVEETRGRFEKNDDATYFSKRAHIISGPGDYIYLDTKVDKAMDYETELGVIIGKEGKNIKKDQALDHVFAYTIVNDYSARELQKKHKQFFKGKSLDGYTALGPVLVTKDEISNPNDLSLKTRVNGEVRQNSSTKYMIRDVGTIISELSYGMTLVPGDIIATGTPKGVGLGFKPPKFLKSGDVVESEIEKIGILKNIVK